MVVQQTYLYWFTDMLAVPSSRITWKCCSVQWPWWYRTTPWLGRSRSTLTASFVLARKFSEFITWPTIIVIYHIKIWRKVWNRRFVMPLNDSWNKTNIVLIIDKSILSITIITHKEVRRLYDRVFGYLSYNCAKFHTQHSKTSGVGTHWLAFKFQL